MIDEKKLIEELTDEVRRVDDDMDWEWNMAIGKAIAVTKSQPPADQWIPCSERPPEEPCIYTVEDCSPYTVNKHGEPLRRTIILKPFMWEPYHRVIAWKPINIEPYKGVE